MARTAKKELTPEERIKKALVPKEEQPYRIPRNWQWTFFNCVAKWGSGGTPSRKKPQFYNGSIPWVKTGELLNNFIFDTEEHISDEAVINSSAKVFPKNTVIIAMYGATIGKVGILGVNAATNQACACGVCKNILYYMFLFYYAIFQKETFINAGKGGAQSNISQEVIKRHFIPVPPIPEQRRIVDLIESLFAKLDEAKEKAQAVVDGYEDRKAAILHKAFTGELTEAWRRKECIERSSWRWTTVKDACCDVKVGIVIKPSQYYTNPENGTPAFRSANVREFHVDDSDWVYLNEKGMKENMRTIVHTGDVLVVRSGNPGTACVVEDRFDGYNAIDILIAVPDKEKITPSFLCAFTNSPLGRKLVSENKRGMALAHFNVNSYSALPLELPSKPEQEEIVRIMQRLLDSIEKSNRVAEQVIAQIDTMKKAILARAFRGELGTNDPSEEPVDIGTL